MGRIEMSAPYEEVSPRHRICGFCCREFISRLAVYQHMATKHTSIPRVEDFLRVPRRNQPNWPRVPATFRRAALVDDHRPEK
jgi:hypothetical protein